MEHLVETNQKSLKKLDKEKTSDISEDLEFIILKTIFCIFRNSSGVILSG